MTANEGQATDLVWRHCRWIEPHQAIAVPASAGPVRAMGGRTGAECATCHETLVPSNPPAQTDPKEVGRG